MGICSEGQSGPENGGVAPHQPVAEKLVQRKKMQVYGHHFNSDTRTVLTLLDIAEVEYEFKEVDIFLGQHKELAYLAKNPCGSIPMIID